jgi:anion-transporting  ArsA/GET3 family ATPase
VTPEEFAQETLTRREIVVCVGCGGVGKTTVAAALALEAARRGRRVLVLTIDPARRLADALGVEDLGNRPQLLPREDLTALGVPEHGSLSAVMLDMKRTFDDLVERFTESAEARERVFHNRIYQHATDTLAGSIEYSAMEKVFELYESGDFDLILVDTPPSQHALDFLEAPQRLIEFLDSRLVQMLIHPAFVAGRFGFRLFHRGTRRVLQLLERLSGIGFLEDISEFLLAFEGMAEGFRERARRVRALLLGPSSAFLLVAGPGRESVRQSTQFLDRLESYGVPLAGVLVNRIRLWPSGNLPPEGGPPSDTDLETLAAALHASEGASYPSQIAAKAAVDAATGYAALVRSDARSAQPLRARTEEQGRFWGCIPEFERDVHDLDGLARIADRIVGRDREPSGVHQR